MASWFLVGWLLLDRMFSAIWPSHVTISFELFGKDDFLAVTPSSEEALRFSQEFSKLCKNLGISTNQKNGREGPILDFLGIKLDTIAI